MTLQQLDTATFPCVQSLIMEAGEAAGITGRIDRDRILSVLHELVKSKAGEIYVDNIGLPKVVLILNFSDNLIFTAKQCHVLFVYATPEKRSPESALEIIRVIEQAADAQNCGEIMASSWCYQQTDTYPDISALWLKCGYTLQEHTFVKIRSTK